jgi:hypothetical protein
MTNENKFSLRETIEEILSKHVSILVEDGRYQFDTEVPYGDELHDTQIKRIVSSEDMRGAFYDILRDAEIESMGWAESYLFGLVKDHWPKNAEYAHHDLEDEIKSFIQDNVDFNFPFDHYLKQEVEVNFVVDTGDGNYDYTLNNFASYNAVENEKIEEESSLLWLVKKQGYTKTDLNRLIRKREDKDSLFLKSLLAEAENVTSHMNALAFFVKMTLAEYMDFLENGKSVTFSEDTRCGLYDCWNGAGGLLEIQLEKEVNIPTKFVQPHIEGTRGYGLGSIYGVSRAFWKKTLKNIKTA